MAVSKAQNNLSYYIHLSKQRNTINFVKEGIKKEKAASFTQTSWGLYKGISQNKTAIQYETELNKYIWLAKMGDQL